MIIPKLYFMNLKIERLFQVSQNMTCKIKRVDIPLIIQFDILCMAGLPYTKCYKIQYNAMLHQRYKIAKILDNHEHRNTKTHKIKKGI